MFSLAKHWFAYPWCIFHHCRCESSSCMRTWMDPRTCCWRRWPNAAGERGLCSLSALCDRARVHLRSRISGAIAPILKWSVVNGHQHSVRDQISLRPAHPVAFPLSESTATRNIGYPPQEGFDDVCSSSIPGSLRASCARMHQDHFGPGRRLQRRSGRRIRKRIVS